MGEVYLANDTLLKRKVAIKVLAEEFSKNDDHLRRFKREAIAASALNHPNILTVYEVGEIDGKHYISSEFIDGRTLREELVSNHLTLGEKLNIALQVAEALAAAHAVGIVHRDIKPDNVMIKRDGHIKVLDFGLVKLVEDKKRPIDSNTKTLSRHNTSQGMMIGTAAYMSPEQARGKKIDVRSDIWSLGVLLYEMLARRLPFHGDTTSDTIASILRTEPTELSKVVKDCPAELERIVTKALQKNREERYQVVKDLALDLKSLSKELEFSAKIQHISEGTTKPLANRSANSFSSLATVRRFSLIHALAILIVSVLVLGSIWWLFFRSARQAEAPLSASLRSTEIVSWSSTPGEADNPGSFSPDGKMIAFDSTRSGARNIWVKQTASGEAVQVTKDEFSNRNPVWSPSGDELAFFSRRGNQPGIWRMPTLGGTPTLIRSIEDTNAVLKKWSSDDLIYFVSKQDLYSFAIGSGQTSRLTEFDTGDMNLVDVGISDDGQQIAYITDDNENRSVWILPVRSGQPNQIVTGPAEMSNIVWHPDNKRILYSSNTDGAYQIFVASVDGGAPARITSGDSNCYVLDVSEDGTKVLYGSSREESDLWGINLAKPEEFSQASDVSSELWPDISPDGRTVAYQAVRNLSHGDKIFKSAIYTKPAGGKATPFQVAANGLLPSWSTDGNQLAFIRAEGNKNGIWIVNPSGGRERPLPVADVSLPESTLLPYNRLQNSYMSWSPDGSRIVYCSRRGGKGSIWIVFVDGSKESQLTENGDPRQFLYCPLWSPGGDLIAYSSKLNIPMDVGDDQYSLWVTEAGSGRSKLVLRSNEMLRLLDWSPAEKELIFASVKSQTENALPMTVGLRQISIETGEQRSIANIESAYFYNIRLSRDRKSIAFAAHRDEKDNIWVMPTAGGEAKKITSNNDPNIYISNLAWSPDDKAIFFGKQSRRSVLLMITNFQ